MVKAFSILLLLYCVSPVSVVLFHGLSQFIRVSQIHRGMYTVNQAFLDPYGPLPT